MPTFKTKRLCATPAITPAKALVEITDEKLIKKLLKADCIEPFEGDAEAAQVGNFGALHPGEGAPADGPSLPGDLDADAFVAWVADGAKVGEVTDWVGDDLERAEIASADKRATVQKHIDALLASDGDEGTQAADGDDADGDDGDA